MGQAPAAADCNKEGIGTPFVKVGEFGAERPIVREWTTDPKKLARESDVLICVVGATCGKINLGANCAIGRSVAAIRPRADKIGQRYLWYFMQGKVLEMRGLSQGAAQTVITREMINGIDIHLPPLEEQRRIVAVLDEAFAAISAAAVNAEKNAANARELMQAATVARLQAKGQGWVEKSLGSICDIYQPETISKRQMSDNGAYPVFGANGKIGRYDRYNHAEPQLLVTCRGATCGSINMSEPVSWVTGNAMVVRPRNGELRLGLLRRIFETGFDFNKVITGAAQPQITRQSFAPSKIVFPVDLNEQERLEAELDEIETQLNALEENYDGRIVELSNLKKSLLSKAFSGQLGEAEPLAA
jgi:type I restriction enzyme S subunit